MAICRGRATASKDSPDETGTLEQQEWFSRIPAQAIQPKDGERYHICQRRAFNHDQRGFPMLILRPEAVEQVSQYVAFAAKEGVNLCVAGGAHSSKAMMNDCIAIDLFHLDAVTLNEADLIVQVQGGSYLKNVDDALASRNLGVPIGSYPWTGVGGLTLGGGYGWLGRMYGFTVDNLVQAQVVFANGSIVIANDSNE
jgi:FAD/FMN-containing dehydrogenase